MKIAVLFSNYMYSYIELFLELCSQNGIKADFFKFADDKVKFDVKAENKYILKSKWRAKDFNSVRQIEEEIKSLVNVNDYDYFLSDTIGLSFENACSYFHGNSTIYKIEHIYSGVLQYILKILHADRIKKEAVYYKNTKLCLLGSSGMKQDFMQHCGIKEDKIRIIPPGADNRAAADVSKKEKGSVFEAGAAVCGFKIKGGYYILSAAKMLKKEFTPEQLHFKIIHPNYDRQPYLKLYVKLLGIEKYVEFLPFQKNMNNFYASCSCFICASNIESFGRTAIEAMLSGVPVIAGSNIGASDVIDNGINGYVYEYGKHTAENLAAAVKKAYYEKDSCSELIKRAEETASKLNWKNFSHKLFDIITA